MSAAMLDAADPFPERLVASARAGSRAARRELLRKVRPGAYPLALAVTGRPIPAARAVRLAVADALADRGQPFAAAVVSALHSRAAAVADDPDGVRGKVALALRDGNGLSRAAAARLLGMSVEQFDDVHSGARAGMGLDADPVRCRGWAFVARDPAGLTPPEVDARESHLRLCPDCPTGLAHRDRARSASRIGKAGAVGAAAVGAVEAAILAGGTTAAGIAVGGAIAGGLAAVPFVAANDPGAARPGSTGPADPAAPAPAPGPGQRPGTTGQPTDPNPAPGTKAPARPGSPAGPTGSARPSEIPLPVPSGLPAPVPTSVPVPVPLPTGLPVPTSIPLPPLSVPPVLNPPQEAPLVPVPGEDVPDPVADVLDPVVGPVGDYADQVGDALPLG